MCRQCQLNYRTEDSKCDNNVIEKQYISTAREHKNKKSQPNNAEKNNNSLVILRYMHKQFSYSICCNSYLDLASSNNGRN